MVMGIYKCLQALHLISTCVWLQFLSETFNIKSLCNTIAPLCVLGSITSPWQQLIGRTILSNKLRLFWGRISYHRAAFSQRTTVVLHKKTHDPFDISSRSCETTFSREVHRFQFSSVNLPCLRGIIVHWVHESAVQLQLDCSTLSCCWSYSDMSFLMWASLLCRYSQRLFSWW